MTIRKISNTLIVCTFCIQLMYTKVVMLKGVNGMSNKPNGQPLKISAKDFAYYQIKQWIIDGKLYPDQSVVEEELSTKLEISRTPLREALQRLELENMVVRKSNGRLKIAPISAKEVTEIFNVRSKLEEIITVEATENATDDDIKKLSTIVNMLKEAYRDGNIGDILYHGAKFHSYIYELSGNKTVNNILSQLNDHIHRYRRLVPSQNTDPENEVEEEHQVILDYIANRDSEGAARAMQEHIEKSLASAITAIETYEKNRERSIW